MLHNANIPFKHARVLYKMLNMILKYEYRHKNETLAMFREAAAINVVSLFSAIFNIFNGFAKIATANKTTNIEIIVDAREEMFIIIHLYDVY